MTFRTWLHRNAVTLEALYVALVVGMVLGALALYRAERDAQEAAPVNSMSAGDVKAGFEPTRRHNQ